MFQYVCRRTESLTEYVKCYNIHLVTFYSYEIK